MATILIVDDQPANRDFLAKLLTYKGHDLLEATDGSEALAQVHQRLPDLVISDILMPTMDGYEFVRQLRNSPPVAQTPVIFYTATYHEREARALAQACGVKHLITKPSHPDVILRTVDRVLGHAVSPAEPSSAPPSFSREHLQLLTNKLAEKVAELEAANGRQRALVELGRQLTLEHDPLALVECYCRGARRIVGTKYAAVGLLADDRQSLKHYALSGIDPATARAISPPNPCAGLLAAVLMARRPVRVQYLEHDPQAAVFVSPHPQRGTFLGVAIASSSQLYGVLYLVEKLGAEEFSEEDEDLAMTLAAQLGVAYRSARQYEDIQQQATRLQAVSRRLLEVQEAERRHLARELHDEFGQVLTAISNNLQNVKTLAGAGAQTQLDESISIVDRAIQQVRALSLDLRPSILDDFGLAAALRWYVDRLAQRLNIEIQLSTNLAQQRFASDLETACFRVAQEALTNIARHAQARRVWITLRHEEGTLQLVVRDDGVGFDLAATRGRAAQGRSCGLLGMEERVQLVGGKMHIESQRAGGTTVRANFPLSDV